MAKWGRVSSSSLTGIFAPGAPALVESLRTLVVTPPRAAAPGETVRAEFAFSNLGGAPATGVRVRFALPQGVTHAGEDTVDDRPLADGEQFVDAEGAAVGDLEPGSQRTVSCSFRVHDTIEDGTELMLQAALVTAETPLVASNIERIVVYSAPALNGAQTALQLLGPDEVKPGSVLTVRATIANTGASSARDVVAMLPVPERTTYVKRSARVGGRLLASIEGEAFDYDAGTIVAERLMPGQSVVAEYQVSVDAPLADGTRIGARGTVASRECAEFDIESPEVTAHSPVDFDNAETALAVKCDDVVTPGMHVPISLRATNAGTGDAQHVSLVFALPQGLAYAPGSAHVDGQPVDDDVATDTTFGVGTLAAGRSVEAGFLATVTMPNNGDDALPIDATLRWKGGTRAFSRHLRVRTAARFNRARNFIEADRGTALAGDDVRCTVHVYNDGTAPERSARLRIIPGAYVENVRVAESSDEPIAYDVPLELGVVAPHAERTFTVVARVASPVPDRSHVSIAAVLENDAGAIDIGSATVVVRSRPQIARDAAAWELASNELLRPGQTADVAIRFTNGGSDVLRDARIALRVPDELTIERAINAHRDGEGLSFGDVPAHATHEARFTLRLQRAPAFGAQLALTGWLHGRAISPVRLPALDVPTFAEPNFESAALRVSPSDSVNAGDRAIYELLLRNTGDGPAQRLLLRVVPPNLAVYVPSSTTLNGTSVADDGGLSALWAQRGLALADVTPGVDLRVRWEMIVMAPLAAGTAIDARAILEWDDGKTMAVAAPTLHVVAQPTLGETQAGTPISVARTFPSRAQAPESDVEDLALHGSEVVAIAAAVAQSQTPATYVDFSDEQLQQTLQLLERADAGGIIRHLYVLRSFFPTNAGGASPQLTAAFAAAGAAVRAPLDRLFVRLHMPQIAVTANDLEDADSRAALQQLLAALDVEKPGGEDGEGATRVVGPIDLAALHALAPQLESAPLGSVTPWLVCAHLLGTTVVRDGVRSEAFGTYRRELLDVLTRLSDLPVPEFHRTLTSSVNRSLDEALAAALAALREAAPVASR